MPTAQWPQEAASTCDRGRSKVNHHAGTSEARARDNVETTMLLFRKCPAAYGTLRTRNRTTIPCSELLS
eukprot:3190656-Pyramimonas_sp.AAC.1